MAKNTVDVTDASFDSDVLKSDKTVLVDFWAEWCGPCKMVAPVLDEIAGENKERITVAKLDIDVNQKTAQAYQVMSIPTMIVFQNGKPVKQIVGARPKAALLSDLADYLGCEWLCRFKPVGRFHRTQQGQTWNQCREVMRWSSGSVTQ
jgi:thioredoxin 1